MDDEQRKKVRQRVFIIKELMQKEKNFNEHVNCLMNDYAVPMRVRYQQQADLIFKGVEAVQMYAKMSVEFLYGAPQLGLMPFIGNESEEAFRKANIAGFLENFLNKYIMCFRVFMKGTYEATEYLTKLNDKDPFKKWLEEQRIKSEKMLYLEDYLDRIRKHPGQVELLVEKIVKYTLDSDPTLPKLKEQQLLLKKNMSDLNLVIASQNTKALKDLQTLQTLIGPSIKIIIQTRHLITKGQFYCVFPRTVELLQFYLCNDVLLYGKEQDKHYTIQNRFYMVDSVVEREEGSNIITIQDHEKCLTFYSAEDSITSSNEMSIEDWYNEMLNCIANMQKKQRLCGICNESCKLSSSLQKELDEKGAIVSRNMTVDGKEPLKAVTCRGCGRSICERCVVDMRSDPLQDAVDKTLYCLHCRNWNKREWDLNMSYYQTNPVNDRDQWKKASNPKNDTEYWFDDTTHSVSWNEPSSEVDYGMTSVAASPNSRWLTYLTPEGKTYYYDVNTNQVQWKTTMETKQDSRICIHCGMEPKLWQVVCPRCNNRWSI